MKETSCRVRDAASEEIAADRKALLVNLDKSIFGTFAEIGAAQEVARHFFRVGGAAATIAKTMSAYDMTFSDEIYGKATRYVSKARLVAMLDHEYSLLLQRLDTKCGAERRFFAFADTVVTRGNDARARAGEGWLGIRFQSAPRSAPCDIRIHVRMLDADTLTQQEALGIVGVNLIFAAFHYSFDFKKLVESRLDGVSRRRVEIDIVELSGPSFEGIDRRLVALELLNKGLTESVVIPPEGDPVLAQELLFGHAAIVLRGRFSPFTFVHREMIEQGIRAASAEITGPAPRILCEITLNNASAVTQLGESEILARTQELSRLGFAVMITVFPQFHRLVGYLRRCTAEPIFFVAGIDTLVKLHVERYYTDLEGGVLEALGRLFQHNVKVLFYPMPRARFAEVLEREKISYPEGALGKLPEIVTTRDVEVDPRYGMLLAYLRRSGVIADIPMREPQPAKSKASKDAVVTVDA